jgi:hypothetical protein
MSDANLTIAIDQAQGKDICVEDRYMKPTAEYPDGSWLHLIDGKVEVATGYYATIYPDKPSPYWHSGAPCVVLDTADWPWEK